MAAPGQRDAPHKCRCRPWRVRHDDGGAGRRSAPGGHSAVRRRPVRERRARGCDRGGGLSRWWTRGRAGPGAGPGRGPWGPGLRGEGPRSRRRHAASCPTWRRQCRSWSNWEGADTSRQRLAADTEGSRQGIWRAGGAGALPTRTRSRRGWHRCRGVACQLFGTSDHGRSLSTLGSGGRPSTRSPSSVRRMSDVPASMVLAGERRNALRGAPAAVLISVGCVIS
ncbi:hypothetical protein BH18ACT4_BH18ACT4_15500 [soil metagenome]